jgi:hypothetical protein
VYIYIWKKERKKHRHVKNNKEITTTRHKQENPGRPLSDRSSLALHVGDGNVKAMRMWLGGKTKTGREEKRIYQRCEYIRYPKIGYARDELIHFPRTALPTF